MRQASGVAALAGMLAATLIFGGVALAEDQGSDRTEDGCRVIHESGKNASGGEMNDSMSAGSKAGNVESHITMGNGGGSASTSVGGSSSTGVTAGNGEVTTTTTHNGKGVTVHSPGSASSAGASSSDGSSATAGAGKDCVVIDKD